MSDEPFPVIVHPFPSKTRRSCAYELGDTKSRNAIIFIGGLTDGPHTTPYIWYVAKKLEESTNLSYSVFEFRMRSSYRGFGSSSLSNDVEDISSLVKYLRGRGKEKIVLFGHSTGTQVCKSLAQRCALLRAYTEYITGLYGVYKLPKARQ
jgi:pimeloyl-ACP methyl ester carboxylesterase